MCFEDKLLKVSAEAWDNSLVCSTQLPLLLKGALSILTLYAETGDPARENLQGLLMEYYTKQHTSNF